MVGIVRRSVFPCEHEVILSSPFRLLSVGYKNINQFARDVQRPDAGFCFWCLEKVPPRLALQLYAGRYEVIGCKDAAEILRKVIDEYMPKDDDQKPLDNDEK